MSTASKPPLIVPKFLPPCKCLAIAAAYSGILAGKKFMPNGKLTTDMPLRVVSDRLKGRTDCKKRPYDLRGLRAEVAAVLGPAFGIDGLMSDYSAYTQVLEGGRHTLHADGEKAGGVPNHCPWRVATGMLYLGTGGKEFDGGELCLPEFDLKITPETGLLVGIPCTWTYRHEVLPVTRGIRNAIIFWYTLDGKHAEYWPMPHNPPAPAAANPATPAPTPA